MQYEDLLVLVRDEMGNQQLDVQFMFCKVKNEIVTKRQCMNVTADLASNKVCHSMKCTSKFLLCHTCLKHGEVKLSGGHILTICCERNKDYCSFHLAFGKDAHRSKTERREAMEKFLNMVEKVTPVAAVLVKPKENSPDEQIKAFLNERASAAETCEGVPVEEESEQASSIIQAIKDQVKKESEEKKKQAGIEKDGNEAGVAEKCRKRGRRKTKEHQFAHTKLPIVQEEKIVQYPCPFKGYKYLTETQCTAFCRSFSNNKECVKNNCGSPWIICIVCIGHEEYPAYASECYSVGMDIATRQNLCRAHLEIGYEKKREPIAPSVDTEVFDDSADDPADAEIEQDVSVQASETALNDSVEVKTTAEIAVASEVQINQKEKLAVSLNAEEMIAKLLKEKGILAERLANAVLSLEHERARNHELARINENQEELLDLRMDFIDVLKTALYESKKRNGVLQDIVEDVEGELCATRTALLSQQKHWDFEKKEMQEKVDISEQKMAECISILVQKLLKRIEANYKLRFEATREFISLVDQEEDSRNKRRKSTLEKVLSKCDEEDLIIYEDLLKLKV